MQRGTIWSLASACGLAAFAWCLMRPPIPGGSARPMPLIRDAPSLTRWLSDNPADVRAWFDLATLRDADGDADGARAAWQAVLHDGPSQAASDDRLWFVIAWAADRLNDPSAGAAWGRASRDYESRINTGHYHWMFWDRLAWTRKRTGNDAGATQAWDQAATMLALDPHSGQDPRAGLDLARELAMAGRTGEALDALERINATLDAGPLARDPRLEALRDTARFKDIVGKAIVRQRNAHNQP